MSPQLTVQQMAQVMKTYEEKVASKKLEIAALGQFRELAPDAAAQLFAGYEALIDKTQAAADNFLTAKINSALIDLRELELTLKMLQSQSTGIVGAGVVPTLVQRPRG